MKNHCWTVAALLAGLVFSLAGCGQSPQPIDAPASSATPSSPHGMASSSQESGEEARVSGNVLLEGAGFVEAKGTLYVNVRLKGQKAPWLSRMYPLASTPLASTASGARSLAFDLRSRDPDGQTFNLNGQHVAPSECEVYLCYKPDRFVESPTLAEAVALFETGKSDYAMTLSLP